MGDLYWAFVLNNHTRIENASTGKRIKKENRNQPAFHRERRALKDKKVKKLLISFDT